MDTPTSPHGKIPDKTKTGETLELQKLELKIAQLKSVTDLAPLLTSKDSATRKYALTGLRSATDSSGATTTPETRPNSTAHTASGDTKLTVLNSLLSIALSENETDEKRTKAIKDMSTVAKRLAHDPLTSPFLRDSIGNIFSKVAQSDKVSPEAKKIANETLKEIRSVTSDEIDQTVRGAKVDRPVSEIILHSSMTL